MSTVPEPPGDVTTPPPTTIESDASGWQIGLNSVTSGIRATIVHDVGGRIGEKFFDRLGISWANDQSKRRYGHAQAQGEMPSIWETWNFHPMHKPRFNYFFFPGQAQRFGEMFVLVDGDPNFVNSAARDQEWELTFTSGNKVRLFVLARWVINEAVARASGDTTRLYVLHLVDGRYFLPKQWSIADTLSTGNGVSSTLTYSDNFVYLSMPRPSLAGGVTSDLPPTGLVADWLMFGQQKIPSQTLYGFTTSNSKVRIIINSGDSSGALTLRARSPIGGFEPPNVSHLGGYEFMADQNKLPNQDRDAAPESRIIGGLATAPYNTFRFIVGLQRYGMYVGKWAIDLDGNGNLVTGVTPGRTIPVWTAINVNTTSVPTTHAAMVAASSNYSTVLAQLQMLAKNYQALQGLSARGVVRGLRAGGLETAEHECVYVELFDHNSVMSNWEVLTKVPYKSDCVPWNVPYVPALGRPGDFGQEVTGLFNWDSSISRWKIGSSGAASGTSVTGWTSDAYLGGANPSSATIGMPGVSSGTTFLTTGTNFTFAFPYSTLSKAFARWRRGVSPCKIYNDGSAAVNNWFDAAEYWSLVCVLP